MNAIKKVVVALVLVLGMLAGMPVAQAQNSFTVPTLVKSQGDSDVVGTIANLAASASASIAFDLGVHWQQYTKLFCVIIPYGPAATAVVEVYFGDVPGSQPWRAAGPSIATVSSGYTSLAIINGQVTIPATVVGRYVSVKVQNSDATNAFGSASNIRCAAQK